MKSVYKCGTKVYIINAITNGIVVYIKIEDNNIYYGVSYFLNNTKTINDFNEYELDFKTSEKIEIGFK